MNPVPVNVGVQKAAALVRALGLLHNFCIDQQCSVAPAATPSDALAIAEAAGFDHSNTNNGPKELLGNGEHFEDVDNYMRRAHQRNAQNNILPWEEMHQHVIDMGITRRPAPMGSTSTSN